MNTKDISELKSESDRAERLYQEAIKTRRAAVLESAALLKAATKARSRYMRALGAQAEGGTGIDA